MKNACLLRCYLVAMLLAGVTLNLKSQTLNLNSNPNPKIGLVLGGGGAKGGAEVGVLKVLEEAGIRPDYIVGTSIGSIVGCLYAAGYTATELEEMFTQQEWLSLLTDRRADLSGEPYKVKDGVTYIFGFPVIDNNNPTFGVLRGGRVEEVLDSMLAAKGCVKFNCLPIPFRCVAASMMEAEEVVLSQGKLPRAVRASMAIPGIFKPVEIDGEKLVDGGMMNNLPVDVCREMGADFIIAVDLQQEKPKNRESTDNIITSIVIAAQGVVNEVCIFFGGSLIRGNRATKYSSDGLIAFLSPNYPALAEAAIDIHYNYPEGRDNKPSLPLHVQYLQEIPIAVIKVFPGINFQYFREILNHNFRGIVIETFGAGNIPGGADNIEKAISEKDNDTIYVICSQCPAGSVSLGQYETSTILKNAEGVSGLDMTTEAAVAKLYYLLSKGYDRTEIIHLMEKNLRGEIKVD